MNELYYGDCLDVLKEMHNHKLVQIPGKGLQTTFKKSVKRVDVEEEGMFEE
ncbi:MAG: hypothetical protein V1779_03055 [bacterium]